MIDRGDVNGFENSKKNRRSPLFTFSGHEVSIKI